MLAVDCSAVTTSSAEPEVDDPPTSSLDQVAPAPCCHPLRSEENPGLVSAFAASTTRTRAAAAVAAVARTNVPMSTSSAAQRHELHRDRAPGGLALISPLRQGTLGFP